MAAANPNYGRVYLYGPFHRRHSPTQSARTMVKQLLSGEVWGKVPRYGISLAVEAIPGPLPPGQTGFEFWAFEEPDRAVGPRSQWTKGGPYVTIDSGAEVAKLKVAISRVTQDLLSDDA
jgi:hypothetical protein